LRDAQGNFATSAVAFLTVVKVQNGTIGTEEIPRSTPKADSGNQFRYGPSDNQYIYNLATDTMVVGNWRLKISLDDSKIYTAVIMIK